MNVLLFDGGNSRIKWALLRDGRLGRQHAVPHQQSASFAEWLGAAPAFERMLGINVAGQKVERILRRAARENSRPAPVFITSSAQAGGVRSGYARPALLGADRWAAAIAAWHGGGCHRTVCAVSIGTALTIDLVDHDGYHRGGLIAPGPGLMLQSLLERTADIATRAAGNGRGRLRRRDVRALVPPMAGATRPAIDEGCLGAAAGFIDRTVNQLTRSLGVRPVVFITGGASAPVIERLRSACRPVDDLVLRGVAAIAGIPLRRRA